MRYGHSHTWRASFAWDSDRVIHGDSSEALINDAGTLAVVSGGPGNDWIRGGADNDIMYGNDGDDILDGGAGVDTMYGGNGNDTYVVTSFFDETIEEIGATGIDLVLSSVSRRLGDRLENLTLTGPRSTWGTGNDLDNVITGNAGANILSGLAGNDTLIGGRGDDTLVGGAGVDAMDGGAGIDTLDYSASIDSVNVNLTTNAASGGDAEGDTITNCENVIATALNDILIGNNHANVLEGGDGDDILSGMQGADVLIGGAGNDYLDGGSGVDVMYGGDGDDTYIVTTRADQVIEVEGATGIDTVISSVTHFLGDRVENLTLVGSADIWGRGNALDNVIIGNSGDNIIIGFGGTDRLEGGAGDDVLIAGDGADTLVGGEGNDTLNGAGGDDVMIGGDGDDWYIVGSAGDVTIEASKSGGHDSIVSAVSLQLGAFIEDLVLVGFDNLRGTGNTLDNFIKGNEGENRLNGGAGNDTLEGFLGDDLLIGGTGADAFVFRFWFNDQSVDRITDFAVGEDRIHLGVNFWTGALGELAADAFAIGAAPADASDRIIYNPITGQLFVDFDGAEGAYQMFQFAQLAPGLALSHTDFLIT